MGALRIGAGSCGAQAGRSVDPHVCMKTRSHGGNHRCICESEWHPTPKRGAK